MLPYRLLNVVLFCCLTMPKLGFAQPNVMGQWGNVQNLPLQTIHGILLKNGKILCLDNPDINPGARVRLFDPVTASVSVVADPPVYAGDVFPVDLFCSGQTHLADGRVVFFGGGPDYTDAHDHCVIFDPDAPLSNPWTNLDDMPPDTFDPGTTHPTGRRWYPTATRLADGKILVLSGGNNFGSTPADTPLLLTATAAPASQFLALSTAVQFFPWYPMTFQLSQNGSAGGKVCTAGSHYYNAGAGDDDQIPTRKLQITGTPAWTQVTTSLTKGGSACMYRPDQIMKAGGGLSGPHGNSCGQVTLISDRAFTIDMSQSNPVWTEIAPMNFKRVHFYLVPLPDGKVLAVGGSQVSGAGGCNMPAYAAELYDPENPSAGWVVMDSTSEARMYHSAVVLLPDGRVLAAGGQFGGPQLDAELFSPPYLFQGPRPTITAAPAAVSYGSVFTITTPDAGQISTVSLIGLGAATHSFDHNTRFMNVPFVPASNYALDVIAPATGYDAPPGYYMLFILVNGVPSVAKMIQVGVPLPPTAASVPHDRRKNRYISFTPNNAGATVAFRVQKTSSPTGSCWVQTPVQTANPMPAYNDQYTATCDPTPVFRVWTEPVVHVGDCEIIPVADYHIYANAPGPIENPTPLFVPTILQPSINGKLWADSVGSFNGTEWTPPNQIGNVSDVLAILANISGSFGNPHFTVANLQAISMADSCLNPQVNTADTLAAVQAVAGASYGPPSTQKIRTPSMCPTTCPCGALENPCMPLGACCEPNFGNCDELSLDTCSLIAGAQWHGGMMCDELDPPCTVSMMGGPGGGGEEGFADGGGNGPEGFGPEGFTSTPTFGLTSAPYQINADATATVNVYLDAAPTSWTEFSAYEVSLDVADSGPTTGSITREAITINTGQSDYIFAGYSVFQATNVETNVAGAAEGSGAGVVAGDDEYLAHWTFRSSPDAYGVFEVRVNGDTDRAFVLDAAGNRIDHDASAAAYVRVGCECTAAIHCDDGNQCTSDVCTNGACVNANLPSGAACNDGLFCTLTDTCNGSGVCTGSATTTCVKPNPVCCEETDSCHPTGYSCELE